MVHFKRDAIRKSIETVTTHFRQLIARKSKNESKTTWSIVCPITLTQRLLTKTTTTYFRRLIAWGAKINALRLCTMCTGKCAGRDINRKYIHIYCLLPEIYEGTAQSTTQISVGIAVHNVHILQCTDLVALKVLPTVHWWSRWSEMDFAEFFCNCTNDQRCSCKILVFPFRLAM